MPGTTNRDKTEDPCTECKKRHVKCDDVRPRCRHCIRSDTQCLRPSEKIRFRPGSTAKYDSTFAKGQQWPTKSPSAVFQFIDVNPDVEALYTPEHNSAGPDHSPPRSIVFPDSSSFLSRESPKIAARHSTSVTPVDTHTVSPPARPYSGSSRTTVSPTVPNDLRAPLSPLKRTLPDDAVPHPSQIPAIRRRSPQPSEPQDMRNNYRWYGSNGVYGPGFNNGEAMQKIGMVVSAEMRRLEDDSAAAIPDDHFLSPPEWRKHFRWPNSFTTNQCTSLMRYFIEELGPWFDAGDPNRTFATIVPRKACSHPPLLNAIFTAAAFHLVSSKKHRGPDQITRYQGVPLPRLNGNTPWKYFQAVIAYLTKATDPQSVQDEDFLAAAVILRFAEEFQQSTPEGRPDAFTPTFRNFIKARAEAEAASGLPIYGPLTHYDASQTHSPFASYEKQRQDRAYTQLRSFEHACYRVVLRQDICAVLLAQTAANPDNSIELELPRTWSALDAFPEPGDEDFIWADHNLRHLAHVVRYCHPKDETSRFESFDNLKLYESKWEKNKPYSFAPYHDPQELHNGSEARRETGRTDFVLPQCWFMDEINIIGGQYIELSRILMAECNPSVPRLGRARHKVESVVRDSVTRICGMAMNTSTSVFAKELALVAVALTTAYFKNYGEHVELLKVLDSLEGDFGWPTDGKRQEILQVWGMV